MPIDFTCAECGKAFCVGDAMAGLRGRCSGCGHVFRIPGGAEPATPAGARPEAPGLPPRGAWDDSDEDRGGVVARPRPRPARPARKTRSREWTDAERGITGFGVKLIAVGVLAQFLPLVGLQFRIFRHGNATTAGIALAVIGVVVMLLVQVKRHPILAAQCVAATVVALFLLRTAIRLVFPRPGPPLIPAPVMAGPGFAAPQPGPALGAGFPANGGPPPWAAAPPPPPPGGFGGAGPVPGFEHLSARFGAGKVAVLRLTGDLPPGAEAVLHRKLRTIADSNRDMATTLHRRAGEIMVSVAPVADLDACSKRIDFGQVTRVDPATRTLDVTVTPGGLDPSNLSRLRPGPADR